MWESTRCDRARSTPSSCICCSDSSSNCWCSSSPLWKFLESLATDVSNIRKWELRAGSYQLVDKADPRGNASHGEFPFLTACINLNRRPRWYALLTGGSLLREARSEVAFWGTFFRLFLKSEYLGLASIGLIPLRYLKNLTHHFGQS